MCKILKVSTSGYYNWLKTKASKLWLYNQELSELITTIFNAIYKGYGVSRIKVALENLRHYVSKPRVERLMRANNLFARRKRKFIKTTDSKHNYPIAPNMLIAILKQQELTMFGYSISRIYKPNKAGCI